MGLLQLLGFRNEIAEVYERNPVFVDVRTKMEFKTGSVPKAVNIPLNELPARIKYLKKFDRPVIVFCRTGSRSRVAKNILRQNGLEAFNGGSWNKVARMLMK